jgi:hypothetical protein
MQTSLLLRSIAAAVLMSVALVGPAGALEVGQKAPDFALNGVDGKPVKLSDLTAKGPVAVSSVAASSTACKVFDGSLGIEGPSCWLFTLGS